MQEVIFYWDSSNLSVYLFGAYYIRYDIWSMYRLHRGHVDKLIFGFFGQNGWPQVFSGRTLATWSCKHGKSWRTLSCQPLLPWIEHGVGQSVCFFTTIFGFIFIGDLMGSNGDLMGFNGDLMGFNGD